MFRSSLQCTVKSVPWPKSFECLQARITWNTRVYSLLLVYRPEKEPSADSNRGIFFEEFDTLISVISLKTPHDKLILTGDFNFHLENTDHPDTLRFTDILAHHHLLQHVDKSTHDKGHLLDAVISRVGDASVSNIHVSDASISDHYAVSFTVNMAKPPLPVKTIRYRKVKSIDIKSFASDVSDGVQGLDLSSDLESLVDSYDRLLGSLLDKHAPAKSKLVHVRPNIPWFNDNIILARKLERKLERKYRRSKLVVDRKVWKSQARNVDKMIEAAKVEHFSACLLNSSTTETFKTVKSLLYGRGTVTLPSHECSSELAERFSSFFSEKVQLISDKFPASVSNESLDEHYSLTSYLDVFKPVTEHGLLKLISDMKPIQCA
ncbi:uncharacterized protein LOC135493617 [Lineus longissimus]|uniref:uncharacterized protein LOC135493617 n=1 Tax=Lineus longissimus TaxID=88925 RepID=UPI00315C8A17